MRRAFAFCSVIYRGGLEGAPRSANALLRSGYVRPVRNVSEKASEDAFKPLAKIFPPEQTISTAPVKQQLQEKILSVAERDAMMMNAWKDREGSLANAELEDGEVEHGLRRNVKANIFRVI